MSDFINKIVTIILIFVLLVLAPLLISYKTDDMMARREILNDVETFIDKVQDTSTISENDLNRLYITCNSHGLTVDVKVKRIIATEVYELDGTTIKTNYFAVDEPEYLKDINAGDMVQVTVKEVTTSTARRATYKILSIAEKPLDFTLAGVVG